MKSGNDILGAVEFFYDKFISFHVSFVFLFALEQLRNTARSTGDF
jgi:hypothetical protein